jgi:3-deoxy-D-manno-octulosonic-acid transferase
LKRKAIFLLYRVLQTLASPALAVYLLFRGIRNRQYFATLGERLGQLPALWQRTAPGSIWLHAVSAGEILAALPLIEEIRNRHPRSPIFVSTSTLAGREAAFARLSNSVAGVFYAPLDFVWMVRRVLRRIRPSVVIVMETEIWPHLFREVRRIECGLIVVNGRISDRALPRYRKFAALFSVVLPLCDRILVQSQEMRARFVESGAPPGIVEIAGNLKYDFNPVPATPDSPVMQFLEAKDGNRVWIAASTSADESLEEEDFCIAAQRELSGWRLILAPRKPDRFERVAKKLEASGLSWTRRTALTDPAAGVLLLDSIGELGGLFAHADVVFMGGTLAHRGGHNILEPALFGKPVIAGPHLENFRDIEEHFETHGALLRIQEGAQMAGAIRQAARQPDLGRRAREAAFEQKGATARSGAAVTALYNSRYPIERPAQPVWALLCFFSLFWRWGSARDRRKKSARARRLPVPVVSVGNISAGGTGKTPVTIELLREFASLRPGLLTRGYGRSTSDIVLLPHGNEHLPISLTGDEAQLYLRSVPGVPIGVGGDRYETGRRLLERSRVPFFFLDDGFQHLQLERDFDLVLIDGLRPFGGGHLLPLGRLREPLESLDRAHAFLITRSREVPNIEAIEAVLRRYNSHAPIFHACTELWRWMNGKGELADVPAMAGIPSVAFCGLGNPQAFWRSLERAGVHPIECHAYDDHHRYSPSEVRRLVRHAIDVGAKLLLTTAKDAVNLCPEFASLVSPIDLYWLEIRIEIAGLDDLIALIRSSLDNIG